MTNENRQDFQNLILDRNLIVDVRAPIEFAQGHLPGSVNLPILEDDEREKVGTVYKQQGSEKAIQLGHQLVSGEVKELRLQRWLQNLGQKEDSVLTCFRGGMRSQLAQSWCAERGLSRARLAGGYKAFRQFLIEQMNLQSSQLELTVVSGATGCGKTFLLNQFSFEKVLDLEQMAGHRGSAFGARTQAQPSQATFENRLSWDLVLKAKSRNLIVEDESRMIGSCAQPESFFQRLRSSKVVMIEESLQSRTNQIFQDYILDSALSKSDDQHEGLKVFEHYEKALHILSRKLGGLRFAEILQDLRTAKSQYLEKHDLEPSHVWISKLLDWYYDPIYRRSLERRNPQILFRGSRQEVQQFLESRKN